MQLSWNLRILLGVIAVMFILVIGFFIYYTIERVRHDGPIDVEPYPDAELIIEESLQDGWDRQLYNVQADPQAVERFYQEDGYLCHALQGLAYEDGIRNDTAYLRSTCLLDRSHSLGFRQEVTIIIQPERTPYVHQDNNPANAIIGGGELTGNTAIDVRRQWGNVGILGG